MNKFRSRGQPDCRHRPSSYSPRSAGGNLRFFDQTDPTRRDKALLLQTKAESSQPKTNPPSPKAPPIEARLEFPPPANNQPQQGLFKRELPAAKTAALIFRHKLTPGEREQLVEDHRLLVENLLRNYKPASLSLKAEAGLAAAAQIGLITAAENFEDHRPKWQFTVHAQTVIIDEIHSELRSYQLVNNLVSAPTDRLTISPVE